MAMLNNQMVYIYINTNIIYVPCYVTLLGLKPYWAMIAMVISQFFVANDGPGFPRDGSHR